MGLLRRIFSLTGQALDIKELASIFGGASLMTAFVNGLIWFVTNLPIPLQILTGVGVFLLMFVGIRQLVLIVRRREIPNQPELLSAIATYETNSRSYYNLIGSTREATAEVEYVKASQNLQEQVLISGLSKVMRNPITKLEIFGGFRLIAKLGKVQLPKSMVPLTQLEYAGQLRPKADLAITWVRAITK